MTVDHVRYDKNHEEYLRVGRNLLDDLTRSMALSGIGVGHNTLDLPDGTRIIVSSRNGGNDTEIIPPEKIPGIVEEKEKKEEEEEDVTPFFAVGVKVLNGPDPDAAVYLGVWEPEDSEGNQDYRIVDNRMSWNNDHPLIETKLTLPDIRVYDGLIEERTYQSTYSNDNGMTSFTPVDGGLLEGYSTAVVLYDRMVVIDSDSGDEIDVDTLGGYYIVKIALDPSCQQSTWDMEIKLLLGMIDLDRVYQEHIYAITIEWGSKEVPDGNARFVVPFGVDAPEDDLPEDYYLPPSCFSWDDESLHTGPARAAYGPNPHAANYWQGAVVVGISGSSESEESSLVPWLGFEEGTMLGAWDALSDMGFCDVCDEEPPVNLTQYEFPAGFNFRVDNVPGPFIPEACDAGWLFSHGYAVNEAHAAECEKEGGGTGVECFGGGGLEADFGWEMDPGQMDNYYLKTYPGWELIWAEINSVVWEASDEYQDHGVNDIYPVHSFSYLEWMDLEECVRTNVCEGSSGGLGLFFCGNADPIGGDPCWWTHDRFGHYFWWKNCSFGGIHLDGGFTIWAVAAEWYPSDGDREIEYNTVWAKAAQRHALDYLYGISYAGLPMNIKSILRPLYKPIGLYLRELLADP